jgi:hypothetical protein
MHTTVLTHLSPLHFQCMQVPVGVAHSFSTAVTLDLLCALHCIRITATYMNYKCTQCDWDTASTDVNTSHTVFHAKTLSSITSVPELCRLLWQDVVQHYQVQVCAWWELIRRQKLAGYCLQVGHVAAWHCSCTERGLRLSCRCAEPWCCAERVLPQSCACAEIWCWHCCCAERVLPLR